MKAKLFQITIKERKNDGTERYITDINTIPRAEGVGF